MKSVVIGYGFIGRHLVDALIARGDEVTVIEKRDTPLPPGAIRGDMRYLESPVQCDYAFHLAGITNYAYCEANPLECIEGNVMSTVGAIKKVRAERKFMLASSAAVYAPKAEPLAEYDEVAPHSIYGASKRSAELFVQAKCEHYFIARFFNVYGPGQSRSFIVPQLIHEARQGRINLRNRNTYRDYIFVEDAVRAVLAGMDTPTSFVMNVGSGRKASTGQIAEVVASAVGTGARVESKEIYDDYSPRTLCADISRAQALGWAPANTLADGVRKTVEEEDR